MKRSRLIFAVAILLLPSMVTNAQKMPENEQSKIIVEYLKNDFPVSEFKNKNWNQGKEIIVNKYWSGEVAPRGRWLKTKILWSKTALYVRFEANQTEPLVISDAPNTRTKTLGLWDRDVCEIFVAPNRNEPRKYYEFEIAPTGEWIDLGIYQKFDERITDWNYESRMQSAAKIEKGKVWMAIKIEWKAFGVTPKAGDVWLGNLFRCVGSGEARGYLAWSPTQTKEPNFHVPEKFGEFEFVK